MKAQDEIQKVIETINRKIEQNYTDSKLMVDEGGDFDLAALESLSVERDDLNKKLTLLNWVIS